MTSSQYDIISFALIAVYRRASAGPQSSPQGHGRVPSQSKGNRTGIEGKRGRGVVWCGCKKGWEGVTIEDSVCGESLKRSVGDDGVLPVLTARLLCSKMTLGSI